ncbi:undecaprenyl-diphosphatase [Cypionkella sp.]|uniref:undecaprenyl-diphosphatase n=1 Tax=Cypionkella sp. TaxID=2811411 RepID=UPI0037515D1C
MSPTALEAWNQASFLLMTAGLTPDAMALGLAKALAQSAVTLVGLVLILGWVRGGRPVRFALLDATASGLLGLSLAVGITQIYDHPRPFAIGLGQLWIPHAADASFPSDHGTLLFALAASLLISGHRLWATGFLALGLGVAWARIYLGVHFPLDMIGAAAVAVCAAALVRACGPVLRGRIYPVLGQIYEVALVVLHLPARWFPRDL